MVTYYVYRHISCFNQYFYDTCGTLDNRFTCFRLPYVINCRLKEKLPC